MPELPIPVIIYRLRPEEAYNMGVLADAISDIGQLQAYSEQSKVSAPSLPILAALSTEDGLAHSAETKSLWLLHPQLQELQVYRDNPPLLALKQFGGFYEAYLSHNSSPIPYEWCEEWHEEWHQEWHKEYSEDRAFGTATESWLEDPKKQAFLGSLGNHFCRWPRIFSGATHAELPDKLKEATELLEQEFADSGRLSEVSLPLKRVGRSKQNIPAEAWLNEAKSSLEQLYAVFVGKPLKTEFSPEKTPHKTPHETPEKTPHKTPKEQQSVHLAQTLWALLAFWISAKLSPASVLRKLGNWLEREKKHQELQKHNQEHK